MNANIMSSKIEMTKTEAIAAGKLNSDKFNELKTLREMFPTFQIEIVKIVTKRVDHFKGLTYKYMENYIKDNNESLLSVFYALCGRDEKGNKIELAAAVSYGEVRMWFLTEFPEIEQMSEDIKEIIKETRKTRESRAARKVS